MGIRVLEHLVQNTKGKPNEDFLHISEGINAYAVSDGCTLFVPHGKEYPTPSPARTAAEIFCKTSVEFLEHTLPLVDFRCMRKAFRVANREIRKFNEEQGISMEKGTLDYLEHDFAGCVGVLGALKGNTLRYGYIGDCGLMVFDKNLLLALLTPNECAVLEQVREMWGFSSGETRRLFWNRSLRNHPQAGYLTHGVLTGEEEALSYVKTGVVELKNKDTAVLFSDGMLPYLFDRFVREAIAEALESHMDEAKKKEVIVQAITRANYTLTMHGFLSNLDDDKAFIAFQLV